MRGRDVGVRGNVVRGVSGCEWETMRWPYGNVDEQC